MSASFPVPAPGPFNAQSPVFPQPFAFPTEAYQQGFNPSSNPFPSSNGAHHSNPMFDAKQLNGYGFTSSQGPMGGAALISPTANVQAPFGAHPMRHFHQPGMPKPCVALRPRMLQHMGGVMPMNGQMHQMLNQQPTAPMSHQQQQQQLQQHQQQQQQQLQQQQHQQQQQLQQHQQLQQQQQMQQQQQQHLQHQSQQQLSVQQGMHQQASNSQQMPSQSPSQAHPCSSPMQCNRQSPGSNRVAYSTNTMRPSSNGNSHVKSEQSPASLQQTSGDQISLNSGMSSGAAMSPASCSVFGGSSQPPQASDQGPPQPPNTSTPFPLVTHYDMPPAFQHLQESFQMRNPALQMYYKRRKTLLILPYPNCPNLPNVAPVEPPTFAFLPHTKHYDVVYDRRYPAMNPILQGQPGMHNRQPIQSPQMMSPAFTQPQPPNKAKAPPAKKARNDSTDGNFSGMHPNSGMMMAPGCMPPRHMQQMPPDMLQHYGAVPTSHIGMNPTGAMQQYYPSASPNAVPTSVAPSVSSAPSMNMSNGMYPMSGVPHSSASMSMGRLSDMSQQVNDSRSQQVPVSGVFQNVSNGRMSTGDQQSLNSPRNQSAQSQYQQQGNQFDISPQCPKCLCLVSPTNRSVQCNGPCMRLFHQNCTGLLPRAFALLEEDPSAKWVCGACESSVL